MVTQDTRKQTPEKPTCGRTQAGLTQSTDFFNLSDFDNYVAFHRKCDIIEHGDSVVDEKMSQKKCRFCD